MAITTFEGVVSDGQIRLHGNVTLPENARVYVVVPDTRSATPPRIASPRLAHRQDAARFAKQVVEATDADV